MMGGIEGQEIWRLEGRGPMGNVVDYTGPSDRLVPSTYPPITNRENPGHAISSGAVSLSPHLCSSSCSGTEESDHLVTQHTSSVAVNLVSLHAHRYYRLAIGILKYNISSPGSSR